MTSPSGRLTALVCRPTKKVNKAEEITYLSTNFGLNLVSTLTIIADNIVWMSNAEKN
jgi:hypothetical protein